ncbi:cereblon isoform X1 [Brachionus plicatilis]|uniref:Cereblon isoform X1 n=1 Tax=Brachionus plicatilis TaxID=10195 RepID=A0A3M7SKU5_BRAPC|nr:cereblon isoform X1 [Brachionus plicatilis]
MSSSEESDQLYAHDAISSDEENFQDAEENEYNIYFAPEDYDEEDIDDEDEEETESDEQDFEAVDQIQDYEDIDMPAIINYNTELSSNHQYLGQNFEEISASKLMHDSNDVIQIPILDQPSDVFFENDSENSVQLIPGQVMPIYFYSPIQIQVIRKRLDEKNPTIGFCYNPKLLKLNRRSQEPVDFSTLPEESKLGIVAEIISASYHNENSEIADFSSLIESAGGVVLKVKGNERFEIKDITGIAIGTVKILPEYVLSTNPLNRHSPKNLNFIFDSFLHKSDLDIKNVVHKAEYFNTCLNQPAWVYRNFDCDYLIHFIKKELNETFKIKFEDSNIKLISDSGLADSNNSKVFCSWLLTNFPFDNKMRINILRMNCINQRLILCNEQFCSKANVFSMTKHGFMGAYLNPGGVVHETLTVSKPSTQHSWFPGYAWQIITCKRCNNHIGWKFTNALPDLKPERFFGLTRKAIRYAYQEDEEKNGDSLNFDDTASISQE